MQNCLKRLLSISPAMLGVDTADNNSSSLIKEGCKELKSDACWEKERQRWREGNGGIWTDRGENPSLHETACIRERAWHARKIKMIVLDKDVIEKGVDKQR